MNSNSTTLFGGKNVTIYFEPVADPAAEGGLRSLPHQEIKVRQVPVRDYERGMTFVEDEVALVGFLIGKDKNFAQTLMPESYDAVLTTGREVNAKGFFSFCQRRMEQIDKSNAAMIGAMASMSPETLKLAMEAGLAKTRGIRLNSQMLSPGLVPPPVA